VETKNKNKKPESEIVTSRKVEGVRRKEGRA
jgi:hypothetical protein